MHSILIVEDDMNINGLLKEALEKADYLCKQCIGGKVNNIFIYVQNQRIIWK